jgi:predicted nucleotidyltransferase
MLDSLILAQIEQTFADEPIEIAYLFGSRARGDAGPLSDVDIAVLAPEDMPDEDQVSLQLRLMTRLMRALRRDDIEVIILNRAPILLQHRVIRVGKVLFCRDELLRSRYEARVLVRYFDSRHLANLYNEGLMKRIATEGLGARP